MLHPEDSQKDPGLIQWIETPHPDSGKPIHYPVMGYGSIETRQIKAWDE